MHPTIIIGPNSDFQHALQAKTADRANKWVAPSGQDLSHFLLGVHPETVLAGIFSDQLSLVQLSPYQVGAGVNHDTMFFGRRDLISHIINREPANYLLVGGRQVGKSSLLKALERRYESYPELSCCYLTLSSEVLVPRLAAALDLSDEMSLEEIAKAVSSRNEHYIFLIDEADKFIRHERETDYTVLAALRRMSEEGWCHFILAGFWELYEHAVLDYQSPLKNFGEILRIGALESDACRALAQEPMKNMRLQFETPALVERLLDATGQRANLMAIACHQILEKLSPEQRIIKENDVSLGLESEKIRSALKGWDNLTDDKAACSLDSIVVLSTVKGGHFNLGDLAQELDRHRLSVDARDLDRSLERLELAFILGQEQGRYIYRVPLFRDMLCESAPEEKLKMMIKSFARL